MSEVLDRFRLDGRVALVTGGNRGLGRAFALALAGAGARVAIVARDAERSARVVEELRSTHAGALAVEADITLQADVVRMFEEVEQGLGAVDILVNNAGACVHRPALEVNEEDWDSVLDLNLTALWRCCREAGSRMRARGGGVIVNIGSISADIVNRPQWQPGYNASKAAVHQLTKSLAAEWAPYGIRVNALAPGYVKTEMAPVDDPRFRNRWILDAAMQRAATPEEIGPSLVYLASDASAFMTGSVLVIDGGYTLF